MKEPKMGSEKSSVIFKLAPIFEKEMKEVEVFDLFEKIEIPLTKVLAKMELEGIL